MKSVSGKARRSAVPNSKKMSFGTSKGCKGCML